MKKKISNLFLVVFFAALAIAAIYYISTKESWDKKYIYNKKEPYDTYLIHKLLFNKFDSNKNRDYIKVTDSTLNDFFQTGLTYVFIGKQLFLDSADQSHMLSFVAQGNTALISSEFLPDFLYEFQFTRDTTYLDSTYQNVYIDQFPYTESSNIKIKLENKKDTLVFPYVIDDKIYAETNGYLEPNYGFSERVKILGHFNHNNINFFSYDYGKGKFLIHTTPQTLTNYALSKEDNLAYADFIFSQLDPKTGIFWDEYNKNYHFKFKKQNTNEGEEESPLRYILSQPGLRYAWYLALALLILYFIFVGKRRQRAIPVLEKLQNSSLEFIKTVGKLYYSERDHRGICMHKMKLYNNFLRSRYSINANTISDELKERIAIVSGVSQENVNKIYSSYFWIEKQIDLSDDELIEFNSAINNFYKQCK